MKFFGLFARSGLGAALTTFAYGAIVTTLFFGVLPLIPLVVQAVITGVIFGAFYSLVHLKREPSFLSSVLTAASYMAVMALVSIFAGTFAGLSIAALAMMAFMAVLLGGGSYLGTRFGR